MLVKNRAVTVWLVVGLLMVFLQIVIGGVTRLTGSGLSITKWEIVTGTIPPLNSEDWNIEFEEYKLTPQYRKINFGMTLSEFKFIYFWEYFHRLWARSMGFVFIIPFLYFLARGLLSREIVRRLAYVVFFAAIAAGFGWIMVASGLEERPWVNAYKLSIHLGLALLVFSFLLWTLLRSIFSRVEGVYKLRWLSTLLGLICIQIFLGGMVSGMKAAMLFPTWPDMHGSFVPEILLDNKEWSIDNFINYDRSSFLPALSQLLHRTMGYIVGIWGLLFVFRNYNEIEDKFIKGVLAMVAILIVGQILLGISVLIGSIGEIPVILGVMHQSVAILILSCFIVLLYFRQYGVEK